MYAFERSYSIVSLLVRRDNNVGPFFSKKELAMRLESIVRMYRNDL